MQKKVEFSDLGCRNLKIFGDWPLALGVMCGVLWFQINLEDQCYILSWGPHSEASFALFTYQGCRLKMFLKSLEITIISWRTMTPVTMLELGPCIVLLLQWCSAPWTAHTHTEWSSHASISFQAHLVESTFLWLHTHTHLIHMPWQLFRWQTILSSSLLTISPKRHHSFTVWINWGDNYPLSLFCFLPLYSELSTLNVSDETNYFKGTLQSLFFLSRVWPLTFCCQSFPSTKPKKVILALAIIPDIPTITLPIFSQFLLNSNIWDIGVINS